jgi:hypothetical protein
VCYTPSSEPYRIYLENDIVIVSLVMLHFVNVGNT